VCGGGARVGDGDAHALRRIETNPPNPTHAEPGFFMPVNPGVGPQLRSVSNHHELIFDSFCFFIVGFSFV
jgi:hypothetical protein